MNTVVSPEFSIQDFKTGSAIIARLPLTNPPQAARDLERFIDILMAAPPDAETYFRLLEHIRLPISFVTEDLAKRYLDKPLPLADLEEELFQQVLTLWKKSARAYAHCAEIDPTGNYDAAHALRVATVLHRCVWHSAMFIHEHWRIRRELPWGAWLDVHGYYASAEEWEITQLAVPDALDPLGRSSNVEAAFAGLILCDMASCYSLTSRQQALARRWSVYWAPLVSLTKPAPGDPSQAITVQSRQYTYSVDDWEVVNQSANGFRLARSTSGKKMMHGALLALCPHDGGFYMLAKNTWLMQEKGGGLIAGMRLLPGKPAAIAARGVEENGSASGAYERAFLLPAIAAVNAEQSVILPAGWYRLGRIVEIFVDGVMRIRLLRLLDAGHDFERIAYELA